MQTIPVTFENRVGYRLAGLLDMPENGSADVYALFAHCFTCGKDLKPFANLSAALAEGGIATLRFDFSGLGGSDGDFSESNLTSNARDLVDAADFLHREHAAAQLLIGHSLGGVAVMHAARHIDAARAVVTIAAPSDAAHLGEQLSRAKVEAMDHGDSGVEIGGRRFTLKRQFFEDLANFGDESPLADLSLPLLVLHSPSDRTVDLEHAARIFRQARHPKSFVSLGGADHLMLEKRDARYAGRVIAAWSRHYVGS